MLLPSLLVLGGCPRKGPTPAELAAAAARADAAPVSQLLRPVDPVDCESLFADTQTGLVTRKSPFARFSYEGKDGVLREGKTELLRVPLASLLDDAGAAGHPPVFGPDAVVLSHRVVALVDRDLVAFDRVTGKRVWTARGPALHLVAAPGDLVVAMNGHWLVARHGKTGAEAFRADVPRTADLEVPFVAEDRLLVVRGKDTTFLLDPPMAEGTVLPSSLARLLLPERVLAVGGMRATVGDVVVVTPTELRRIHRSADIDEQVGKVVFRSPVPFAGVRAAVMLDAQDLLILAGFSPISDSGAELMAFETKPGGWTELWRTRADPLGVGHEKYEHRIGLGTENGALVVASLGSSGSFVERRDLKTGKVLSRRVLRDTK